jgi:hypothetical protein
MTEVSIFRLNLLRAGYLVISVGLGITLWPSLLDPAHTWPLNGGVVVSMLGAMSALAVLGIRYPLQMLPLFFFEIGWKVLWLLRMALPLWLGGHVDAATRETIHECLWVVVLPLLVPWRYVLDHYARRAAEPWRSARAVRVSPRP